MLKELYGHTLPYRRSFWGGTILSASGYASWLIIPWAMGAIITFAAEFEVGGSANPAWELIGIIAITALYYYASLEISRGILFWVFERASMNRHRDVLQHISSLNLHWHEKGNTGSKLKVVNRGIKSLLAMYKHYANIGIDVVVNIIGIPIVLALLSWELNVIIVIFFFIHINLSRWLTKRAQAPIRDLNAADDRLQGMQFEMLNSITTIKSLGMQDQMMHWIGDQIQQLLKEVWRRILILRTRMSVLGFERQIFRLIIIGFSVWKVVQGEFEVGMIAQVYFYFGKIEVTAERITSLIHHWTLARIDMEAMQEVFEEKTELEEAGSHTFNPEWKHFSCKELQFKYGDQWVLDGVDFQIQKGEKIGVVGVSGAGKSTLIKLLLKLYTDYEGFIGFDEVSLNDIQRKSYVKQLSVVMQDTELFDLSIKDNIVFASNREQLDEQILQQALEIANLWDWVQQQANGWDTLVGEKGIKLSGGEKQRLGIARAVYRQPDILFLDEATSHLDAESENLIQESLEQLLEGTTAIVIAHRLSTLRKMDRIIVLENGRIIQQGDFLALAHQPGLFQNLWQKQQIGGG